MPNSFRNRDICGSAPHTHRVNVCRRASQQVNGAPRTPSPGVELFVVTRPPHFLVGFLLDQQQQLGSLLEIQILQGHPRSENSESKVGGRRPRKAPSQVLQAILESTQREKRCFRILKSRRCSREISSGDSTQPNASVPSHGRGASQQSFSSWDGPCALGLPGRPRPTTGAQREAGGPQREEMG